MMAAAAPVASVDGVGGQVEMMEQVFVPDPSLAQAKVHPPSVHELKKMKRAFRDARDKWKIDSQTMKCFYLHGKSGYLYCWDQPTGVLYEFEQHTGNCQAVWTSAVPQLNAEIWTVLPLPPTDPASLQASYSVENLPNIDAFLNLTVSHESGREVPLDVIQIAADEFCGRFELSSRARSRLQSLPRAGQCYIMQNFRSTGEDHIEEFNNYLREVQSQTPLPWGSGACTLRIEATGAIIGRCCPDLDALCREDPPKRLARMHCKVMSEQDRFYICDLGTSEEGTLLDGFALNDQWVGPLKTGSVLTVGPLRIEIQLSDMAKETEAEGGGPSKRKHDGLDEEGSWRRKVFQRSEADVKEAERRRQQQYKDRAEERRQRSNAEAGSAAIDGLIHKFDKIVEAEKKAEEEEANRVERPAEEAQTEANMRADGSFIGFGQSADRAGIGFNSGV